MAKINIKIKQLAGNRIKIVGIENALTRKQLPREYTEHVPYMYWADDSVDPRYLVINWIGGIGHFYIGDVYPENEFQRIKEHIEECELKLQGMLKVKTKKTAEDIKKLREISARLKELGVPEFTMEKVDAWINEEEKYSNL